VTELKTIPLPKQPHYSETMMLQRTAVFWEEMKNRRTVRHFSSQPVSREIISQCLRIGGSAPSGANCQPWHFVAVSNPELKRQIREAAEEVEQNFYSGRAPTAWLDALKPLGTDCRKPFLEEAPWLIGIFSQPVSPSPEGAMKKNYYVRESVGIATGLLITAFHHAGLATLTYTPAPMQFLNRILNRPETEKPFLLLVVGFPAPDATVPQLSRKPLDTIATFLE
jgi:nitroreductase